MKKTMMFSIGAVVSASLVLTGCGGGDDKAAAPEYEVTGKVDTRWIEYECKNVSLSMDNVAFTKTSKPKTDTTKDSKKEKDKKGDTSTKKPSSTPTATASAPVKVSPGQVPTGKPRKPSGYSSKYCTTEYELFIKNGDGTFEQDVPYAHYVKCEEGEKFSSCTA